jgi:cytochrome c oxidase assembly protein subunit 15
MQRKRSEQIWLLVGLIMIFFQIFIGGVTRITGSGLSITKWEIITGSIPPLNDAQWKIEFDNYKVTPQYEKINEGMTLSEFKFIYFWEYIHRLWARLMGFVFLIPFLIFWRNGLISKKLRRRLLVVIFLAALVASLGWIMVASGLVNRPWVNAYKLTLHLCLALVLFGYLWWVYYKEGYAHKKVVLSTYLIKWSRVLLIVLGMQIFLGGIMSGMKAGLTYPTWPDMNGSIIPPDLLNAEIWKASTFINYDENHYMAMIIQFCHRTTAYLFGLFALFYFFKIRKINNPFFINSTQLMFALTFLQILLGILTVINCKGNIPLWYGVLHQSFAIFLLACVLLINFQIRPDK